MVKSFAQHLGAEICQRRENGECKENRSQKHPENGSLNLQLGLPDFPHHERHGYKGYYHQYDPKSRLHHFLSTPSFFQYSRFIVHFITSPIGRMRQHFPARYPIYLHPLWRIMPGTSQGLRCRTR